MNRDEVNVNEYRYNSPELSWSSRYLREPVLASLRDVGFDNGRIFEVGCGNGSFANVLHQEGYEVTGVDPSSSGILQARSNFPDVNLNEGSAYDALAEKYGKYPVVLSLEVIEHCFYPRLFAKSVFDLVEEDGVAFISTPYHGYLKNVALAVGGKMDHHYSPLWDGGHIKFWSKRTLSSLLKETGFKSVEFVLVGRIPWLAKSMIAIARK